ncbi:branched-chain amino acid ABC transporter permease [Thermoanaerobacterium butyriciformans]|uniref:Branched-chain amino acid transport system permease protein n=1 Tax=Thermoanaerobacterium butyriciformans TaxID=1702242 RepID=A0ABS4NHB6_9THEO|nr:branched-chain amino acid ABC transporter permease [Thermoanaerobacterium butyriciformans]MBP2072398.1 branched-chain amino acid transport system permease protein [Thermoanaerobacterium butyriciformans]
MKTFIEQLINGLSLGSIYALIALGYTMVYGIMKLINFAHGDIYMVGAFTGFFASTYFHLGFIPSLLLAMLVSLLLGVTIERVAYRPLRNKSKISILITAIGVSLLLENGGIIILSPQVRTYPQIFKQHMYSFFNGIITISNQQIVIFVVSIIMMVGLQIIIYKTKMGKAMRAVSTDADAAKLMGVNVDRTVSFTFAIGSALAAVAGVLVGIYYNSIDPLMGIMPGLKAFIAAVLGGIGIIPGAMVGGLLMGVIEALVSGYGSSLYRDGVSFAILIIILLIKPTGLFGKNVREKV